MISNQLFFHILFFSNKNNKKLLHLLVLNWLTASAPIKKIVIRDRCEIFSPLFIIVNYYGSSICLRFIWPVSGPAQRVNIKLILERNLKLWFGILKHFKVST